MCLGDSKGEARLPTGCCVGFDDTALGRFINRLIGGGEERLRRARIFGTECLCECLCCSLERALASHIENPLAGGASNRLFGGTGYCHVATLRHIGSKRNTGEHAKRTGAEHSDILTLYCQYGSIKIPRKYGHIYAQNPGDNKHNSMNLIGAFMGLSLLLGTGPVSATLAADEPEPNIPPPAPAYVVDLTAYNAVPGQTDDTPFQTASGAYSNPEIVAARSRDLADELPFGTIIEFDGSTIADDGTCGFSVVEPLVGYRVIEDTMHPRFTARIDLLFGTAEDYRNSKGAPTNAAHVLGICTGATIRVVGHIDGPLPTTQTELAAIVHGSRALARK